MRILALGLLMLLGLASSAEAHTWEVASPDQRQTFSYGSERHRFWLTRGHHLAVAIEFTNDPYVDIVNPRQFDDFEFQFPDVRLGRDGKTFYYQPPGRSAVPVAVRSGGLLASGASLLPTTELLVEKRHGRLHLVLLISDPARSDEG